MAKATRTKSALLNAIIEVAQESIPANPLPSGAELTYLKNLKRRGFTDAEIIVIAEKAGVTITAAHLVIKTKEQIAAEKAEKEKAKLDKIAAAKLPVKKVDTGSSK